MSKYSELVYMVLDELKGMSDDFTYTEDHIIFLLEKYRAFLLNQKYSKGNREVPESNYQIVCLELIQVPAISGEPCEGGTYLRSRNKVPYLIPIGSPKAFPANYYQGEITYVSRDRMRYVGHNKYLQNIIYCSISPDGYMYLKSYNPQFLYLELVRFSGVFQDVQEASVLQDNSVSIPIMDRDFPIEEALVSPLIELVVKELVNAEYRPEDTNNNAHDDLQGLMVKSNK